MGAARAFLPLACLALLLAPTAAADPLDPYGCASQPAVDEAVCTATSTVNWVLAIVGAGPGWIIDLLLGPIEDTEPLRECFGNSGLQNWPRCLDGDSLPDLPPIPL